MNGSDPSRGSQAAYDFWLGLIPQFLGQFGGNPAGMPSADAPPPAGLPFPLDQVAKAASLTQQSLQSIGQWLTPVLQAGGAPNLLAQWAAAAPAFGFGQAGASVPMAAAMQAMFSNWAALMTNAAGVSAAPAPGTAAGMGGFPPSVMPALGQSWTALASQLASAGTAPFDTAFDRTYGALSDAFGLAPARKLYAAWRDVVVASLAQQEARVRYSLLVQAAFTQGFQRLSQALADKASAGEQIDSVLALMRLWASNTEHAMHETLQSDAGLAATAALIRADLAYRKQMQQVAAILAEQFEMGTQRDIDEAYREIQALKRELRAARSQAGEVAAAPAASGATGSGKRRPRKPPPARDVGATQ